MTNPDSPTTDQRKVLVIDDDALIARLLKRGLGREHNVSVVHRGALALELLAAGETFDVIFCDLMMPEMNGMELHAEIERRWPVAAESMIFLTGAVFTTAGQEFFKRVQNRCVYKPFDLKMLSALVHATG